MAEDSHFRRILRPGGNKGAKSSSDSSGSGAEALYDYNGLYEDYLHYTNDYNEEYIYNFESHI